MRRESLQQVEKKDEAPHVRVYLLQSCRLQWTGMPAGQEVAWYHRSSARALFILLLCAPHRQASRSQLASLLWPETDEEKANDSLRSALKYLRDVLRAGQGEDLLEARAGTLTFKGQEHLWLDIDAIADLVRQARNAPTPHEALPLWEQARALLCEDLLIEDRTSEWSQCSWIKVRRKELRAARRAMIRSLSDFSVQNGQYGHAEELLHAHVIRFPMDQDALYRLMKLLIQSESFEEARTYYEQCRIALADLGKQPAEHIKALAQECRSRPQKMAAVWKSEQRLPQADRREETALSFSSSMARGILEASSVPEGNVMDQLRRELMKQGVQLATLAPLFLSTMSENLLSLSKQDGVSSFLDSVAGEQLVTTATQSAALNEESIHAFQDIIRVCWKFCDFGNILLAEQLLLTFLPQIQQLAESSKDAARLAAEGLRLQSVLSTHQLKLTDKITQCLQSVQYARLASEPNTLASSLHELTAAFRYTHRLDALLPVFQEALSFSEQVLPSIRAGIYAGAAAAFAQRNRHKEADFYIHLAYETTAEETPYVLAVVDHGYAHLAEYEGLMYLELGRPQKAFETFEQFTNALSGNSLPERNRLEMLNYQGQAALRLGDVQAYAHCLEKGIEGALAIQSKKRLDEALTLFTQEMPRQWLHEARIKQVIERFQLSTGEA